MYDGLYARFFIADRCSEVHGRAVRRIEERVQLIIPGNQLSSPTMVVTREHIKQWPAQYAAFKSRQPFNTRFRLHIAKLESAASRVLDRWHYWRNPNLDSPPDVIYQAKMAAALRDRTKMADTSRSDLRRDLEAVINKEH